MPTEKEILEEFVEDRSISSLVGDVIYTLRVLVKIDPIAATRLSSVLINLEESTMLIYRIDSPGRPDSVKLNSVINKLESASKLKRYEVCRKLCMELMGAAGRKLITMKDNTPNIQKVKTIMISTITELISFDKMRDRRSR